MESFLSDSALSRMKVIHLACVAPPKIGGIGRVAALEVEELKKRDVDAQLIAPGTFPTNWMVGNAASLNEKKLKECVGDADVVHLHYPFYGTAGTVARLREWNVIKKLVITVHMDATARGVKGKIFDAHRKLFQSRIVDSADALICSSKDYAAHSSFAPWAEKVIELPFGVDEVQFCPGPKKRTEYGIPQDSRVISFVGGMDVAHAFKGVDVLLKAFAELPQNTWLVMGGEGELRASYEKLATELGVASRVKFLGRIAPENLADVYRLGNIFAFPSTSAAEAFGLVAIEAQACGIPVVASDLPGVRTVIENQKTGLLTPAGDARELAAHLRLMLENPGMLEEFGKAARERVVEKYTWKKHIDGLMEVYKNVCASRS